MRDILFKLHERDKASLGNIRCLTAVSAAKDGDDIWIRVVDNNSTVDSKLKQLPVKSTFTLDEKNQLFLTDAVTPVAVLKEMEWIPINEFIPVKAPVSNLPGKTNQKVDVTLIPSTVERRGNAVLTTLKTWKEYAESVSAVRLAVLKFAVSANNEVLVIGNPLPSLPGKEYWLYNNILLPCGYDFEVPFVSTFLNSNILSGNEGVILFNTNSKWQLIDESLFVEAKRSAIRLTNPVASLP
jgi:hypothetical protein